MRAVISIHNTIVNENRNQLYNKYITNRAPFDVHVVKYVGLEAISLLIFDYATSPRIETLINIKCEENYTHNIAVDHHAPLTPFCKVFNAHCYSGREHFVYIVMAIGSSLGWPRQNRFVFCNTFDRIAVY